MAKFIIDSVLIEKSNKDINTGVKYDFSEGFNLICGNNEAGKSSLMKFIKEGFFKTKDIDTGKIYFRISDGAEAVSYRTDIKDAKSKDARCKLFDENNNSCEYSLIERFIKQKYFEEGFTVNLDDLMKIQNKDTSEFIDVIKDPSGDKLNYFLKEIKENIYSDLSLDGKLRKDSKVILDNISALNIKIKELSGKENDYFDSIALIREIDDSISDIFRKENYLQLRKELMVLNSRLKHLETEKEKLYCDFNEKLFNDKELYIDLIQSAGVYSANSETVDRCGHKIEIIENKILENKNRLNIEYGLAPDDESINNFTVEYEKIRRIKELLENINTISDEIKLCGVKIEETENVLLKLKCDIETFKSSAENVQNLSYLEDLSKLIEEGLRQYHFLSTEIGNVEKETIINAGAVNRNKNLQKLLILLFLVTIVCAIVSFYQKIETAGIFSVLMSVLAFAGFSSLKLGSYIDRQDDEKAHKAEIRNNILDELKAKVKSYYDEIDNVESSYLPIKLDSIKQEIQVKIRNAEIILDSASKNESELKYNEEKALLLRKKADECNLNLASLNNEIDSLIDKNIVKTHISGKKYIEAVEILKTLKDDIGNRNILLNELKDARCGNSEILRNIKQFIVNDGINMQISEDFRETLSELKRINERNNILKQSIDTIDVEISNINTQINEYNSEKLNKYADLSFEISDSDIDAALEDLNNEKSIKQELKKEAEYKKRDSIKYEGISELKTEKNVLLNEYRNLVKNLYKNKMVLELASAAKADFDRTQPDLINAQRYLEILTDGKYSKINLDMQELESADGLIIKKWDNLSRGTKEQLYFALRLGYASNYAKDKITGEPNGKADLPLIIDDAFVNFDTLRTKNALKCLKEFSKTNQVLFFTCHSEETRKQLSELGYSAEDNLNVINL